MSNSLRAIQNARKLRQQSLRGGGYDPYEAQATEAVKKERSKANPLQLILDLLQRGQYLTANMVDEAIEAVGEKRGARGILDVLKAGVWEGFITGKRKGSYSDIIEEQAGPDAKLNEPIFKKREGKFLGKLTGADALGFLGDVFLDPATYISFGSTKAASAIASRYADDVVRLVANSFGKVGDDATKAALKGLSSVSDDILKTAAKGFDGPVYKKLLGESTEKAQKYLRKHFDNFAKVQNNVYKEAYKKALNNPDKVLTKDMIERLGLSGLEGDKLSKQISKMPEGIKDVAEGLIAREGYPGAGERAMRFMGGELFKGVREPWAGKVAWNKAEHIFRTSAAGRKLSDFFWAANNRGVIGAVRNALGIRNPYQKHLRMIELDQVQHAEQMFQNIGRRFAQFVGDDQTSRVVREVFEEAEWIDELARVKAKGAGMPEVEISFRDLLKNPKMIDKIEKQLGPEGLQAVTKQAAEIDNLLNELAYKENIWVREFFGGDMGDITNYIPTLYRDQRVASKVARSQSFTKKRVYTRKESIDQQVAKFRSFFKNIPEKDARELIESGGGEFVTDLKDLMFSRIMAHSKMASKVNMIQKFREVGVPIKNITGKDELMEQAIRRVGGQYQQAGLVRLEHPALKEFLFDEDVAKIIDRSMEATGNLRGPIQSVFANYTQWWKGIVTMTPGFHLRNHYNNWLMGFLYYGPRWFQVNKWDVPSIVGTHRALKMRNPKTWFDGTGVTGEVANRVLNKRIGDYTIAELSELASRYGVISHSLHGLDPLDLVGRATGRKMTTMNPLPSGKQFAGVELSRHAGNYIENVPRFKAFLMSYDDITKGKKGVVKKLQKEGILTKEGMDKTGWQIQAAALDAKKIFLDYTDLTDVERKVMKNIIPFYTWLRKNLAAQVNGIALYPGMYSLVPKLEELVRYQDPQYDPDMVPDYMRQLGFFPITKNARGLFGMFNPNIGLQDFARIPLTWEEGNFLPRMELGELRDDIMGAAHPLIKSVVEMIPQKGYDVWRKRELGERAPAPYTLRMFTKNPQTLVWLDGILRLAGAKDGINLEIDKDGKLLMNAKIKKLIENNLPLVRQMDFMLMGGEVLMPELQDAIEDATGAKSDYDKLEKLLQVMSYYFGIKQSPMDVAEQREYYEEAISRERSRLKRDAGKDIVRFRK